VGEKYILGCQNLSLTEIFRMLESVTGIRAPRVRVPHALIYVVALANEAVARATGRPHGCRSPASAWHASTCTSTREACGASSAAPDSGGAGLARAVDWFVAHRMRHRAPAFAPRRGLSARCPSLRLDASPWATGYPLVGVFPRMRRDPLSFFMEMRTTPCDVISYAARQAGLVYLLSHPDHVKHVLQDNARAYAKGPPPRACAGCSAIA